MASGGNWEPETICVLGFGRSGTSLTARVLNLLGLDLGDADKLWGPNETDNARGYWEPAWMTQFNDEILAALGTVWYKPLGREPGWESAPELAPLRERARQLFDEHLARQPLRGWKDPRTTLTLPLWQQVVPRMRYVVCVRNPLDAIASIRRRPEPVLPVREWGELWLEYTSRAFAQTAGAERELVFYEDYFDDAHAQVERLARFLGIDARDRVDAAAAVVERELRHHGSTLQDLTASEVPPETQTVYLGLRAAGLLRRERPGDAGDLLDGLARATPALWQSSCARRDPVPPRPTWDAGGPERAPAERSPLGAVGARLLAAERRLRDIRRRR